MSYQLVSICSTETPGNASAKVLAQSPDIPEQLLSCLQAVRYTSLKPGRHYHYHIISLQGGHNYHVLTTLSHIAEQQYIIHRMVLTAEEVSTMQKNASRPTPAGLFVALSNIDFWCKEALSGPHPQYIEGAPKLTASSIPDASMQDTWKRITGHKSNVKSLVSAGYASKCILKTPRDTTNEDALLLLHESMWLTNYRGWGKSFSTITNTTADIIAVSSEQQLEEAQTNNSAVAVLTISADMVYAEYEQVESEVCSPGACPAPSPSLQCEQTQSELHTEPYKYVEAPDYETFDIDSPEHRSIRSSKYIAALFALSLLVYISVSNFVDFASDDVPESVADSEITDYSYRRFAEIIENKSTNDDDFRKLEALLKRHHTPEHELILECIQRLDKAETMTTGHAEELQLLLRHTDALGVSVNSLSSYYMKRVLHEYPQDEWININTEQHNLQTWAKLFKSYPQLPGIFLQESSISKHMQPIIKAVKSHHLH